MVKENLIHIRLSYEEALRLKKNLLSSQMSLLKIEKIIKEYSFYRSKEIEQKLALSKDVKIQKLILNKMHKLFPKPKIPEILKKEEKIQEKKEKPKKQKEIKQEFNFSLEDQLQEIQRKLDSLQKTNSLI